MFSLLWSSWFFLCWFNICLVQVYAWEMGLEANPTLVVVVIEERRLQSPMADSRNQGWFEHESHCTCEFRRTRCIYSSNCRLQNNYKNAPDLNCISHLWVKYDLGGKWIDTSYVVVSGPWGVIQLWRLAPPGRNPSALACELWSQFTDFSSQLMICRSRNLKHLPHMHRRLNP